MKRIVFALSIVSVIAVGCGETTPAEVADPGVTTPSDIPAGDLPPIPVPDNVGDITVTTSDSVNTLVLPLAGDFLPEVEGITGGWLIEREARWGGFADSCRYTVINGKGNSDNISLGVSQRGCQILFVWEYVTYPNRNQRMRTWLEANEIRPHLVDAGTIRAGANLSFNLEDAYTGDKAAGTIIDPRDACALGTGRGPLLSCQWREGIVGHVARPALTNPVFMRQDVFWEKAGTSAVFSNTSNVQISQSFTRSWTAGSDETSTEQFARSVTVGVTAGVPLGKVTAGANASTSLTQTFGTSISVSESTTESETYSITVSGNTTAVFEVWNLVEQYTFSNADGTPYEDPNYRFSLPSLTSRATIATAFVATPFPN